MITWFGPCGAEYLTKVRNIFTLHRVLRLDARFDIFYFTNAALEGVDPNDAADRLVAKVVPLGQRFYPSECAFPLRKCCPPRRWEYWEAKRDIVDELLPHNL